VARLIHRLSPRPGSSVCGAELRRVPETLLESELFGYARGAFTGAVMAKPGRFELAHRGTLLLDEVGEMPLGLQPSCCGFCRSGSFDRLGDTRSVHVDLRVISTTNRALSEMVREGKFRADLYYRLNVIALRLPPLRERGEDIRELAEHFARLYSPQGKSLRLSAEIFGAPGNARLPGNARELGNCVRRAVALATGTEIGREGLKVRRGIGPKRRRGRCGRRSVAGRSLWAAIGWATIAAMISCGRGCRWKTWSASCSK